MNNVPDLLFRLRLFDPEDQEEARSLILAGLGEHFGSINPNLNPDLNDIQASYLNLGQIFIVAEYENTIVGTGALVKEGRRTGRILRVSVAANKRRLGIGQAIVDRLIKMGRRLAYKKIVVETNHDWLEAIALYKRCGFQEYYRDEKSVYLELNTSYGCEMLS